LSHFFSSFHFNSTSIIKWMKFEWISWDAHDFHGVGLYKNNLKLGCPIFYFMKTFGRSSMSKLKYFFFSWKMQKGKIRIIFTLFYHIEFWMCLIVIFFFIIFLSQLIFTLQFWLLRIFHFTLFLLQFFGKMNYLKEFIDKEQYKGFWNFCIVHLKQMR
jgi:hypothetical protein